MLYIHMKGCKRLHPKLLINVLGELPVVIGQFGFSGFSGEACNAHLNFTGSPTSFSLSGNVPTVVVRIWFLHESGQSGIIAW